MMNATTAEPNGDQDDTLFPEKLETCMWVLIVICTLTSIIGVLGNACVLYFANSYKNGFETAHYLNKVVKHLAGADLMYSILGAPLQMLYWAQGKVAY